MEDRNLNEKESLELIAQMIRNTRKNVDHKAANSPLIWGYSTVLTSLLVYGAWIWIHQPTVFFLWILLPVLGVAGSWIFHKPRQEFTKNHLDHVINQIWLVLGSICWVVSMVSFVLSLPILFFVCILMGAGIILTGCVVNYKPYIYCGVVSVMLSFLCLVVRGVDSILLFAGIFLVMMVIPGHILNYQLRKK